MKFDPISQFGIVLPNEDANDTIIKLTLWGITSGVKIRTPSYEEMDTLPVYDINSSLFWDLASGVDNGENMGRISGIVNNVGQSMHFTVIP